MEETLKRVWWGYRPSAVQELLADAEREIEEQKVAQEARLSALRTELAAAEEHLAKLEAQWAEATGHYSRLMLQVAELSDYAPHYLTDVRNRLGQDEAQWLADLSRRQGLLGRRHKALTEARSTLERVVNDLRAVLALTPSAKPTAPRDLLPRRRRGHRGIRPVNPAPRTGARD